MTMPAVSTQMWWQAPSASPGVPASASSTSRTYRPRAMSSIGSAPAARPLSSLNWSRRIGLSATGPEPEDPEQEPPPDPGDGEKPSGDRPWTKYLQRNDAGDAVINLANAMTALRYAPELSGCFRFDEMLQVPVLVRPLPKGKPGILPRPVRDTDVSIVQEWLTAQRAAPTGQGHRAPSSRAPGRGKCLPPRSRLSQWPSVGS